jgi:4-alpha-glucanotransferase
MNFDRSSGILFHITSLPGEYGIGDMGPEAYKWVDALVKAGCTYWQLLPLGPTGYGDSPYQCFSAFAGNPYIISPILLEKDGFLSKKVISEHPEFPDDRVDYAKIISWKLEILDVAYAEFVTSASPEKKKSLEEFKEQNADWLDNYALFMAIKDANHAVSWRKWPEELKMRKKDALEKFKSQNATNIQRHVFRQFLFYRQWSQLKKYANDHDIRIIGDLPIFVAEDSSDAWANPELFYFDENLDPTVVAGVPPDYYSSTGQLWGNPLYLWEYHRETGYEWWIKRVKAILNQVDIIRIDHFRGFVDYWEIPAGMPTAEIGKWKPGPGEDFFLALRKALGALPIIAEDLGQLNPQVFELRDKLGLPGMKILQFAFGNEPTDDFFPHNYPRNCVAYTGTHDNDTALGWYLGASEHQRENCIKYLAGQEDCIAWDMIRGIWSSVASFAISPMQDFLGLDNSARMNYPGNPSGNWDWRMPPLAVSERLVSRIREYNYLYNRLNIAQEEKRKKKEQERQDQLAKQEAKS